MNDAAPAGPAWITPEWSSPPGVHALSTLRHHGAGRGSYASLNLARHVGDDDAVVSRNRRSLRLAAALPDEPLWLEQVHGSDVVVHDGAHQASPRADAAVAFEPGRVCAVMTADCLPVVFSDRAGSRVGVAHAGWRGLAAGVLEATIAALQTDAAQLLAWLGPAIGPAAFEVGPEVREAFVARHAENAGCFTTNAAGRFQADIYALARTTLQLAGVAAISGGGCCTYIDAARFFSFRRDRATGRMATLAWLDEPA
jgi:YfiH family protein